MLPSLSLALALSLALSLCTRASSVSVAYLSTVLTHTQKEKERQTGNLDRAYTDNPGEDLSCCLQTQVTVSFFGSVFHIFHLLSADLVGISD